jgi:hypothetical protein
MPPWTWTATTTQTQHKYRLQICKSAKWPKLSYKMVSLSTPWRHTEVQLHSFLTSAFDGSKYSILLAHLPAALPEAPLNPHTRVWKGGQVGPSTGLDSLEDSKNSYHCQASNPGFFSI